MTDNHPAARFRDCIERGDIDAAVALFAEDAVFNSPVAHRPYTGRGPLRAVLNAAFAVFENFRYVEEYANPGDTGGGHVLRFRAEVNGLALEGVDILTSDVPTGDPSDGTGWITELTVLVRPYSATTALRDRMAGLLSG